MSTQWIEAPRDYEHLVPWFGVMRQANSIIVGGAAKWLTITVMVQDNRPVYWIAESVNLYPHNRSIEIEDK